MIWLDETVPRSGLVMTIVSLRQIDCAEVTKCAGSRCSRTNLIRGSLASSRSRFVMTWIPWIDRADGNPFRARRVDNKARLRAGDQEVGAAKAALGERVLGMARRLRGVVETQECHGQEPARLNLILPAQLAVVPVGHRDDQTGLVDAQPRAHLRKGPIRPVIRPGQQTSKGSTPAANRRRGRTAKRLLAVGGEQDRGLAIELESQKHETQSADPRNGQRFLFRLD